VVAAQEHHQAHEREERHVRQQVGQGRHPVPDLLVAQVVLVVPGQALVERRDAPQPVGVVLQRLHR
jgi:hypothetical protein